MSILRNELGKNYGYQMLVAFAGDRDYARTERLAKTLATHYPETVFHHYAVRLAEELPERRDDFVTLKLPTPAEWAEMKKKLTRTEQIDFLCRRYRLLNYFQAMQPGGYFPGATQYAEPCGMAHNASWGLGKGKTEVINPETELEGSRRRHDDKPPHGLGLTLKDVPQLSKYLRDDWLIPTVTFWRDFHPNRTLGSTRPMVAALINNIATREPVQDRRLGQVDARGGRQGNRPHQSLGGGKCGQDRGSIKMGISRILGRVGPPLVPRH